LVARCPASAFDATLIAICQASQLVKQRFLTQADTNAPSHVPSSGHAGTGTITSDARAERRMKVLVRLAKAVLIQEHESEFLNRHPSLSPASSTALDTRLMFANIMIVMLAGQDLIPTTIAAIERQFGMGIGAPAQATEGQVRPYHTGPVTGITDPTHLNTGDAHLTVLSPSPPTEYRGGDDRFEFANSLRIVDQNLASGMPVRGSSSQGTGREFQRS
jgi:hypothetical protein